MSTFQILQDDYDDNNARVTVVLGGVHPYYLDIWDEAVYEGNAVGRYQGSILIGLTEPSVAKQVAGAYLKAAKMLTGKTMALTDLHQSRVSVEEVQHPTDESTGKYLRVKWSTGLDYPVTIINALGKADGSEATSQALRQAVASGALIGCKITFQAVTTSGKTKVYANLVGVQHQGAGPVLSSTGGASPDQHAEGFGATQAASAGLADAGVDPLADAGATPALEGGLSLDLDLDADIPF